MSGAPIIASYFALAADGITVEEHGTRLNHDLAGFVEQRTPVFRFDEDVMPASRREIVTKLNAGHVAAKLIYEHTAREAIDWTPLIRGDA